jgi:hypothetical protein
MTCNLSTARQRFGGVSRPLACDILAGVCSFEVGVDGLCERNGDGQCIVGRQRNGTGAAGRSWSEKNVNTCVIILLMWSGLGYGAGAT